MQTNRRSDDNIDFDQMAPPIYTVPRNSPEYKEMRNEEHERGVETFLEAVVLFGGALITYFFFSWFF